MNNEPKVKIFVTYKDKHKIIKSDIITPIQTGRAIAEENFEGMLGDDTGDNISKENPKYNELSAQYWVWKHYEEIGNPEYVGFMHYRRHFIFDKDLNLDNLRHWFKECPVYLVANFSQRLQNNLSEDKIIETISDNADCYAIKPFDVSYLQTDQLRCMREHYLETISGAKEENWEAFYNAVSTLYPQYKEVLDEFTNGSLMNMCNMFIMKKELFFEYCEFLYNITKEIDENVDSSNYDKQEMRFLGYLGEYILTLFIMILQKRNAKIDFLKAFYIYDFDWEKRGPCFIYRNILEKIFSVKNDRYNMKNPHKVFTILGIKIKFKKKIK